MKHARRTVSLSIVATIGVLTMMAAMIYLPFQVGEANNARNVTAGATAKEAPGGQSLEKVLNRDGSLNLASGFRGSLDAHGYRMEYTANGAPRFVPLAASDDDNWDSQFTIPGTDNFNSGILAVAINGSDVYVGGDFTIAGGVYANHIAKWNGSSWSALGSGIGVFGEGSDRVWAIAPSGGDVYVGGTFTIAGGVSANNIAKWNGSSWSALGSGVGAGGNVVRAIAVKGSDVYAGGYFSIAGEVSANYIARWNGSSWSALGSGVGGQVVAITLNEDNVYVGGSFAMAGEINANNIARWNGSNWSALGSGIGGGYVTTLAVSGSDLYAGGYFTTAGGMSANSIAKWNGSSWSTLGSGVSNNGAVYAIAVSGADVYVGGAGFQTAGGIPASAIAKWDGNSWSALGSGVSGDAPSSGGAIVVWAIAVSEGNLYAGGAFLIAGEVAAPRIAKWNGSSWAKLGNGNGLTKAVYAIAVNGNDIYAAGNSITAGGIPASKIAKWDGNSWSALGTGLSNLATAIAVNGVDVYVGGYFTTAGGVPANRIAKWNGSSWSTLSSGIGDGSGGGYVTALAVSGSNLYVGGYFTTAGGVSANSIAKWDGNNWSALGSGIINQAVNAIAVSGTDVYVGGYFTAAGGIPANMIAKWNGSSWSALGSGLDNTVSTIAVSGTDVYVGGYFATAGGIPANNVAKWSGNSWSALGSGVDSTVRALAMSGSNLYVGGSFTMAGGVSANNIAKWNGSSWSTLGSGASSVLAIGVTANYVYVGGCLMAGGKVSYGFGRYSTACIAPGITTQPVSQTVTAGSNITFSVMATGTSRSYQWRRNGSNINGATSSSYSIAAATLADAGNYDVVVTNDCGTATSNAATLTVNSAQTVTINAPANGSPVAGLVPVSITASGFTSPPNFTCEVTEVTTMQTSTGVCSINSSGSGTWNVTGLTENRQYDFKVKATYDSQMATSPAVRVTVKSLVEGQLKVRDYRNTSNPICSPTNPCYNIDSIPVGPAPGGVPESTVIFTCGNTHITLRVGTNGRFSSRADINGTNAEAQFLSCASTFDVTAELRYFDHITVGNNFDAFGCPADPIKTRTARLRPGATSIQSGQPNPQQDVIFPLPIFLHHGILSCYTTWDDWAQALNSAGYIVFTPNHNYRPGNSPSPFYDFAVETKGQMDADLTDLFSSPGAPPYYFITHSQGGVVARVLTSDSVDVRQQLQRVYTLAAPHSGTRFPTAKDFSLHEEFMTEQFNVNSYPGFKDKDGRVPRSTSLVFNIAGAVDFPAGLGYFDGTDGIVIPLRNALEIRQYASFAYSPQTVFVTGTGPGSVLPPPGSTMVEDVRQSFGRNIVVPYGHIGINKCVAIADVLNAHIIPDMGGPQVSTAACGGAAMASTAISPVAARTERAAATTTQTTNGALSTSATQTLALSAGQTQNVAFTVSSTTAALFTCHTADTLAAVSLITPNGTIITPANVASFPNIGYTSDPFGHSYKVAYPQAGIWTLRVTAGSQSATADCSLLELASWEFVATTDGPAYTPSATVKLIAAFPGNVNGLTVNTVTATVTNAAGTPLITTPLYDDGTHGDPVANDKVYSIGVTAPTTAGRYQVAFNTTGAYQGQPFQRHAEWGFDVLPATHLFTGTFSTDSPQDTNGDGFADQITERINLILPSAGQYTLAADLFDGNGNPINHAVKTFSAITSGAQQETLQFTLSNVSCVSFTSGLRIRNLQIADAANGLAFLDVWTTDINLTGLMGTQFGCSSSINADLAVSSTVAPTSVAAGNLVTYTIMVSNLGPNIANSVIAINSLPQLMTLVSCAATNNGVCSSQDFGSATVTFPSLASGASATITLVAAVSVVVPNGAILTLVSTVNAATTDTNANNNTATTTTQVSNATVPTIAEFSPASSSPGVTVAISGTLFTGATSVKFNGTNAAFNVLNGNLILATVPAGATTGPLTVTTPIGTATSASNFTACACSFNPTSQSFAASGGVGSVTVTASTNCNWGATNNSTWIALVNAGGAGNGSLGFAVSPNLTSSPRTGTITIGGQAFNITQATCPTITVNPTTLPNGTAGLSYSQNFMATDGTAPYTFSQSAGTLPTGLTLSVGGTLSGTPTGFGTFNFTARATDANQCIGERAYSLLINPPCGTITVNPAALANGFVGTAYNQTLTATGGTEPYSFSVGAGAMPNGLSLSTAGALTGAPTTQGTFTFTVNATDKTGCMGTQAYTIIISGNGLMFYPLPAPERLLETRSNPPNLTGCNKPNMPITQGSTFTLPARIACAGIPANAAAVTGNITVVPTGAGYLTLFPSNATQPTVANSNFKAGEITNNVFTVGLGAGDGAFKIFSSATTEVIIDVTGYYAPPTAAGLYFHPLPSPVRLLESRPGFSGCFAPGAKLIGTGNPNADPNLDLALQGRSPIPSPCNSIPDTAQVLVGNATSVLPAGGGYLTIYPSGGTRPTVASSNYAGSDVINGPFAVKLGADGKFKVYTFATTDLVIDILGYYSTEANDASGLGLLFTPLPSPARLLETRPDFPGFPLAGCFRPNAPLNGGQVYTQQGRNTCTVPNAARALVGNVTVINPVAGAFLTFWPSDAPAQPTVATSNYPAPVVFGYNRHYIVGLGAADGAFKMFSQFQTDLIVDVSGYFAP